VLYAVALDPSRKFGSLEEQIFLLGKAFAARGSLFLPLFLCPPGPGKTARYHDAGLAAECLDLTHFRPGRLWQLVRLIRRQRIEIIHWNFTPPLLNRYLWGLTLLAPHLQHYFTDHNSRTVPLPGRAGRWATLLKGLLLRRYRKVLCVSQFVHDCLARQGGWSNLLTCLHFINTDRFEPDPAVRRHWRQLLQAGDSFVVVTVAFLIQAKGVEVVCRALAELPAEVVLWLVGDGPDEEKLRRLAQEVGVANRVRFLGNQVHVQPYLQAADCLVCPSLWAEAAGLVNLEAQASGLPVVGSRIGGIPEYVEDGQTGLLFPAGDVPALTECLRQLAADRERCRQMGRQARARAIERFSAHSRLNDYLDLYR